MARPIKWRKVCCMPEFNRFGPIMHNRDNKDIVVMTVDEYETIRLMDHEGMTQEECSSAMGVARTTVQSIYGIARKKIAEALVFGLELHIRGGEVRLSEEEGRNCSCRRMDKDCRGRKGEGLRRRFLEGDLENDRNIQREKNSKE